MDMSCRVRVSAAAASSRQPCPPSCSHRAAAPSQRALHHAHLTTRSTSSMSSSSDSGAGSRPRRMQHVCRVAEGDIGDVLGIAGYLAGTAFFGLWFVEQSRRSDAEVELALCRSKLDDLRAEVSKLQAELLKERKDSSDLDMYKRRYQDSSKEILKLERALELKDGQQEAFMVVAQRQIKYLEDRVRELQKLPSP